MLSMEKCCIHMNNYLHSYLPTVEQLRLAIVVPQPTNKLQAVSSNSLALKIMLNLKLMLS